MDAAAWEEVRRKGDAAIKAWIDSEMNGTSVTVVLIGTETSTRPFVKYEIEQSYKRQNGLLGVYIHRVKDSSKSISRRGKNPLDNFTASVDHPFWGFLGRKVEKKYSEIFQTFDWINDDGRRNIVSWIEAAARRAKR